MFPTPAATNADVEASVGSEMARSGVGVKRTRILRPAVESQVADDSKQPHPLGVEAQSRQARLGSATVQPLPAMQEHVPAPAGSAAVAAGATSPVLPFSLIGAAGSDEPQLISPVRHPKSVAFATASAATSNNHSNQPPKTLMRSLSAASDGGAEPAPQPTTAAPNSSTAAATVTIAVSSAVPAPALVRVLSGGGTGPNTTAGPGTHSMRLGSKKASSASHAPSATVIASAKRYSKRSLGSTYVRGAIVFLCVAFVGMSALTFNALETTHSVQLPLVYLGWQIV